MDYLLFEKKDKENIYDSRKRILKDINEVWNNNIIDNDYINKDKVIKSFKITGISNNLDGSEDDYFDGYNVINDLIDEKEKKNNDDSDSDYNTDKEEHNTNNKNSILLNNIKEIPKSNSDNKNMINVNSYFKINEKGDDMDLDYKEFIKNNSIEEDLTNILDQLEIDSEKE